MGLVKNLSKTTVILKRSCQVYSQRNQPFYSLFVHIVLTCVIPWG